MAPLDWTGYDVIQKNDYDFITYYNKITTQVVYETDELDATQIGDTVKFNLKPLLPDYIFVPTQLIVYATEIDGFVDTFIFSWGTNAPNYNNMGGFAQLPPNMALSGTQIIFSPNYDIDGLLDPDYDNTWNVVPLTNADVYAKVQTASNSDTYKVKFFLTGFWAKA